MTSSAKRVGRRRVEDRPSDVPHNLRELPDTAYFADRRLNDLVTPPQDELRSFSKDG
jgi:hypothetical protein